MSDRPNLFERAPRELSHSAFWAWVLDSLNTTSDDFSDVRRLGARLLREVGAPVPDSIDVQTEYSLEDGAGRIDVRAVLDGREELLIENKVSARPSLEQLEAYQKASESTEAHFLLLSTTFPTQSAECVDEEGKWIFLRAMDVRDLLEGGDRRHPVLVDYHSWLETEIVDREDKMSKARSSDPDERAEGLGTIPGQWAFMEQVTAPFADTGRQYGHRGRASGQPWVEFRFVESMREPDDEIQDAIFYRVEKLSRGPVFRVHQYQGTPTPGWPEKRERLDTLRDLWFGCVDDAGQLSWEEGSNRGRKRCEIARIGPQECDVEDIAAELERVHEAFLGKLEDDLDWNVERTLPCGER